MKKFPLLITAILAAGLAPVFSASPAGAQVLTINSGSTLTINGGILNVNCLDILVKDGGTLYLQSGTILDVTRGNVSHQAGLFALGTTSRSSIKNRIF